MSLVIRSVLAASLVALTACGDGSTTTTGNPPPTGSSTSPTQPAPSGGSTSASGSLGPSCTAYLACCDQVAAQIPQAAGSCDSTRTAITSAQSQGATVASYESACKSGLSSFASAGYCK